MRDRLITPLRSVRSFGSCILVALLATEAVVTMGGTEAHAAGRFPDLQVDPAFVQAQTELGRGRAVGPAARALADGYVTELEYLAGVERTIDCLVRTIAAEGGGMWSVSATAPALSEDRFQYSYSYSPAAVTPVANGLEFAGPLGVAERACQAEHLIDVQWVYQLGLRSDAAYIEEVGRAFEGCALRHGAALDVRGRAVDEVYAQVVDPAFQAQHPNVHTCVGELPSIRADLTRDPMESVRR